MSETKGRLKEFEALRALSILMLLSLHSEVYDPVILGNVLGSAGVFVASLLLGSFFFLAGYFTEVSLSKPKNNGIAFALSKFIRIYPPYWLAFLLYVIILGYTLRRTETAIYLMNLQAVFSPTFVKSLLTLWYISMLVVFYLFYGVVMLSTRSSIKLAVASCIFFALAYVAYVTKGFFDPRFFQYFFLFLAGVFFCRFEKIRTWLFNLNIFIKIAAALLGVLIFKMIMDLGYEIPSAPYTLSVDVMVLTWILLWLSIFRTKLGDWRIWAWLSTASFFAYLYHRPLWFIMDTLMNLEPGAIKVWLNLTLGSALALLIGYLLQRGYDRLLLALRLK